MKKVTNILLLVTIASVILILGIKRHQRNSAELGTLYLTPDCELVTWNDSIQFVNDPFKNKVKSVTYLSPIASNVLGMYIPFIKKYPEVSFLFYFNSSDKNRIIEELQKIEFPIPVFIDTVSENKDYAYTALLVDENNNIIEITNPGIASFETNIKRLLNKN